MVWWEKDLKGMYVLPPQTESSVECPFPHFRLAFGPSIPSRAPRLSEDLITIACLELYVCISLPSVIRLSMLRFVHFKHESLLEINLVLSSQATLTPIRPVFWMLSLSTTMLDGLALFTFKKISAIGNREPHFSERMYQSPPTDY